MHLVFWHNIISPHQAPFMRCLAEAGHEVLVIASEAMSEERLRLGWTVPDLGRAAVVLNPSSSQVHDIVRDSSPDSIHFIAGARGTPLGVHVAQACREHRRRTGIITEAPDPRGLSGLARRLKYTMERFRNGQHFDFILAMGQIGVDWFQKCRYPLSHIYPFAYVTETPSAGDILSPLKDGEILFVGRLVHLKGLDVLLRAMAEAKIRNMILRVVGDGPLDSQLRSWASEFQLGDRVVWTGRQRSDEISQLMARASFLVLPSRKDGWGAVVNESLMAGTPVICSDACGAAELIRQNWLGAVFRSESASDLSTLLERWVGKAQSGGVDRQRIRTWSRCIEGPAVAAYVEQILQHVYYAGPRPVAPWRKENA